MSEDYAKIFRDEMEAADPDEQVRRHIMSIIDKYGLTNEIAVGKMLAVRPPGTLVFSVADEKFVGIMFLNMFNNDIVCMDPEGASLLGRNIQCAAESVGPTPLRSQFRVLAADAYLLLVLAVAVARFKFRRIFKRKKK